MGSCRKKRGGVPEGRRNVGWAGCAVNLGDARPIGQGAGAARRASRGGGGPLSAATWVTLCAARSRVLSLLLLLTACERSIIPEDALWYSVTVTGIGPDECNPGNTEGYQQTFDYAVAFTASDADVYVNGQPFAAGVLNGCNLTYQTVVIGEDISIGEVKWQLSGSARIDAGDDSCVEGDADWEGGEVFTIVDADVEAEDGVMEIGCTYPMSTAGTYQPPSE